MMLGKIHEKSSGPKKTEGQGAANIYRRGDQPRENEKDARMAGRTSGRGVPLPTGKD